ncbi:MAG TPA: AmmeMemoRadiSam system radical SAM enzyme [Candidatus Limnocylindrales bacterium]|nr:AmmeMemoRadiSam system radical SAM enzyme [Candidatus Limnocylindrales bacterium]
MAIHPAGPPTAYTSRPEVRLGKGRIADLPARGVAPALLWERSAGDAVRCHACAHRCLIRLDRRGICGVRANVGGRLLSLVHGEAVAAHAEPIEKKPLFHAWPGTLSFSIATRGCNFHCRFCQNWEIAQAEREGIVPLTMTMPPERVVEAALQAGARSIAYTYVEPTVFLEYAYDTARLARAAGLGNVLVTNGYQTPETIELLAPVVDAANVDLKGFSDAVYRRVVGARLAPVLETLVGMRRAGIWVEVTTLLVPGLTDDDRQLESIADWIGTELGPETPWHVSRYHPAHRMLDVPPTLLETVRRAVDIGRRRGLAHVYAGNLAEAGLEDTRCAACGRSLVRRSGFRTTAVDLDDGRCPTCGHVLAGVGLRATEGGER